MHVPTRSGQAASLRRLTACSFLALLSTPLLLPACGDEEPIYVTRFDDDDNSGGTGGTTPGDGGTGGDRSLGGAAGACTQCDGEVYPPAVPIHGRLSVEDGVVVGEDGLPAQLKGVSTQWLNWERTFAGNEENMRFMRDHWGLEVYRIANGVENDNGYAMESVRQERLELVKQIIETAISLDIYVLVDWHTHELEYLELAKEFFTEIAQSYGDSPHVIYEPLNEPIGPVVSGEADFWSNELKPYHEQIVSTIRAHDPDNLIILGTPRWSQNVAVAAQDPVAGENLAYTLHFYSCSHQNWLRQDALPALSAGIALFVTEWGSTHADGGTIDNPGVCLEEASTWHSWLDEHSIGSIAWKLTTDGDSSAILRPGALPSGSWTDDQISEHGHYVRQLLRAR